MASNPGPSIRMCTGVPSAAREDRCRQDRCPIRCSRAPVRKSMFVPMPWAVRRAYPGPRLALGRNAGPPPLVNWSASPGAI